VPLSALLQKGIKQAKFDLFSLIILLFLNYITFINIF